MIGPTSNLCPKMPTMPRSLCALLFLFASCAPNTLRSSADASAFVDDTAAPQQDAGSSHDEANSTDLGSGDGGGGDTLSHLDSDKFCPEKFEFDEETSSCRFKGCDALKEGYWCATPDRFNLECLGRYNAIELPEGYFCDKYGNDHCGTCLDDWDKSFCDSENGYWCGNPEMFDIECKGEYHLIELPERHYCDDSGNTHCARCYDIAITRFEAALRHQKIDNKVGSLSILDVNDMFPRLEIRSSNAGPEAIIQVFLGDEEVILPIKERLDAGINVIELTNKGLELGKCLVQITIVDQTAFLFRQNLYFSVIGPMNPQNSKLFFTQAGSKTVYTSDSFGNTLPDFSLVGYKEGAEDIPSVPVKTIINPVNGDNTKHIQDAIDEVSRMPLDTNGFRGAILLRKGIYEIAGTLVIRHSGIVLRGEGPGDFETFWLDPALHQNFNQFQNGLQQRLIDAPATVLVSTTTLEQFNENRRNRNWKYLIKAGGNRGVQIQTSSRAVILDNYVPVGAISFLVTNPENYNVGDKIVVRRKSNEDWISYIGMDKIPPRNDGRPIVQWTPFDLNMENEIINIIGNEIIIQIPIINSIERRWGGGEIYLYRDPERVDNIGIENLRAISFWKPNQNGVDDTKHTSGFLIFNHVSDAWVRDVTKEHFYDNSVLIGSGSKRVTVDHCSNLIAHCSYYTGIGYDRTDKSRCQSITGRTFLETDIYTGRYGYNFGGQQNLVRNSYNINSRHAYVVNARVSGPNVFVNSISVNGLGPSEPHHRWSTAGLYDNVRDNNFLAINRLNLGSGHGWSGANYLFWNTQGELHCQSPPTAVNLAIGHTGVITKGRFPHHGASCYVELQNQQVNPKSLYEMQYEERYGRTLGVFGDPTCRTGIKSNDICCSYSCGTCGGVGCGSRPGGANQCCTLRIRDSGRLCSEQFPPCIMTSLYHHELM